MLDKLHVVKLILLQYFQMGICILGVLELVAN